MNRHSTRVKTLLLLAGIFAPVVCAAADTVDSSDQRGTESYVESMRKDPNQLHAFLREMPTGGDLHNHLLGAIYAETFIGWAAEKGLCVDPNSFYLTEPPCGGKKGTVPARNALTDRFLYRDMVDAYS